jgi:glycerophosphoryl diester phosphodiesterase
MPAALSASRFIRWVSPSKWTRSSPSAPDPLDPGPAGFAHRGLHGDGIPENGPASFKAAVALGAGIECDLRLTGDNRIVIFHDPNTQRMCGELIRVRRTAAADLPPLKSSGEPIPTIHELFQCVAGRVPILLEIKTHDDIARWSRTLPAAVDGYHGRLGVMSFDPLVIRALKPRLPKVPLGLVIGSGLSAMRRKLALSLAAPRFIAVDRAIIGQPWVAAIRQFMPVYGWSIRTPEQRAQARVQADALIWESDGRP